MEIGDIYEYKKDYCGLVKTYFVISNYKIGFGITTECYKNDMPDGEFVWKLEEFTHYLQPIKPKRIGHILTNQFK